MVFPGSEAWCFRLLKMCMMMPPAVAAPSAASAFMCMYAAVLPQPSLPGGCRNDRHAALQGQLRASSGCPDPGLTNVPQHRERIVTPTS